MSKQEEKAQKLCSLLADLANIASGANIGNNKEPVWDGIVIEKPNQHKLENMGLVECSHGYYFPTPLGWALFESLFQDKPVKLALINSKIEEEIENRQS